MSKYSNQSNYSDQSFVRIHKRLDKLRALKLEITWANPFSGLMARVQNFEAENYIDCPRLSTFNNELALHILSVHEDVLLEQKHTISFIELRSKSRGMKSRVTIKYLDEEIAFHAYQCRLVTEGMTFLEDTNFFR